MDARPSLHERFQRWITHRYFVRLHMTAMLTAVLLSGVLANDTLHALGLPWLVVRYPIAVLFSYLVFFLLVRLWLAYAMAVRRKRQTASVSGNWIPDSSFDFPAGSPGFSGGGGRFGGGGASAVFEDAQAPAKMVAVPVPQPAGHSGSGWGDIFDIDSKAVWILITFLVAVVGILGAGIYLVVQAPVILSEAAFQGAMAAGLIRVSRGIHMEGWMESVFEATRFPFLVALASATAFGWVAFHFCPQGSTMGEVFRTCVFRHH